MKKIFAVLFAISAAGSCAFAQDYDKADFESQMNNATRMAAYGTEALRGSDILIRDTTRVLHNENMAILDELAKLRKAIADMKKDVRDTKDQVEGGN